MGLSSMSFVRAARFAAPLLVLLVAACGGDGADGDDPVDGIAIVALTAPDPLLEGSEIRVSSRGVRGPVTLGLRAPGGAAQLAPVGTTGVEFRFVLDAAAIASLGLGEQTLDVTLSDPIQTSPKWRWPVEIAATVDTAAPTLATRTAGWDDTLVVSGAGFVFAGEGTQHLVFDGTFAIDSGDVYDVLVRYPLTPVETASRRRASFVLAPTWESAEPGEFEGDLYVETTLLGRPKATSPRTPLGLSVRPSAVLDIRPKTFSVGRYLDVIGTGFVDEPGRATLVRFAGEFVGSGGTAEVEFTVVPEYRPNGRLRLMVEPAVSGRRVVSDWFDDRAGNFLGDVSVVTSGADAGVSETRPLSVTLSLTPATQVIVVQFLSGFEASLANFGLRAARDEIMAASVARMQELYAGYRIEFHRTPPPEYAPLVVSTLEIGGTDPNGLGLFGYDNTVGKDVGNVRMADRIGGANAQTQADGFPGYGGVFIDSFLYWSEEPDLPGVRPESAPPPDPLFDEVFADVRATAATLAEVRGGGEVARNAVVADAVRALSYLIAETAAHEVGHSLGLANPDGPAGAFHNPFDTPGCLMDAGADRPFGERAGLEGFAGTRLCEESAAYLERIHGQ